MLYQSVLLSRICRLMRCLLNDKIKQRAGGSNGIRDLASGKIVTKDMLKWIISHEK